MGLKNNRMAHYDSTGIGKQAMYDMVDNMQDKAKKRNKTQREDAEMSSKISMWLAVVMPDNNRQMALTGTKKVQSPAKNVA